MEKPTINYALAYQKFRGKLSESISILQKNIPIPTYMVEGILSSILSDVRSATMTENALEFDAFNDEVEKYYNDREKELNDEILKLKTKDDEKA